MEKLLITGGCGFIGSNLIRYTSRTGPSIRVLDDLSNVSPVWAFDERGTWRAQESWQDVELVIGDVRDKETVERAVRGVDAVVHLAARASVLQSLQSPGETFDVNVNGTLNVLEACRKQGAGGLVFVSSNAAVGDQPCPVDEETLPRPLSAYGASKLSAEALCFAYFSSFGLPTLSLRLANCYGPFAERTSNVISLFTRAAMEKKPLVIRGDGGQTRDFVHVDDVCSAIHSAVSLISGKPSGLDATSHRPGNRAPACLGEVIQIGSGVETSINELARLISSAVGGDACLIHGPYQAGEIRRNVSRIEKAREALGFTPQVSLAEGIRALVSP